MVPNVRMIVPSRLLCEIGVQGPASDAVIYANVDWCPTLTEYNILMLQHQNLGLLQNQKYYHEVSCVGEKIVQLSKHRCI